MEKIFEEADENKEKSNGIHDDMFDVYPETVGEYDGDKYNINSNISNIGNEKDDDDHDHDADFSVTSTKTRSIRSKDINTARIKRGSIIAPNNTFNLSIMAPTNKNTAIAGINAFGMNNNKTRHSIVLSHTNNAIVTENNTTIIKKHQINLIETMSKYIVLVGMSILTTMISFGIIVYRAFNVGSSDRYLSLTFIYIQLNWSLLDVITNIICSLMQFRFYGQSFYSKYCILCHRSFQSCFTGLELKRMLKIYQTRMENSKHNSANGSITGPHAVDTSIDIVHDSKRQKSHLAMIELSDHSNVTSYANSPRSIVAMKPNSTTNTNFSYNNHNDNDNINNNNNNNMATTTTMRNIDNKKKKRERGRIKFGKKLKNTLYMDPTVVTHSRNDDSTEHGVNDHEDTCGHSPRLPFTPQSSNVGVGPPVRVHSGLNGTKFKLNDLETIGDDKDKDNDNDIENTDNENSNKNGDNRHGTNPPSVSMEHVQIVNDYSNSLASVKNRLSSNYNYNSNNNNNNNNKEQKRKMNEIDIDKLHLTKSDVVLSSNQSSRSRLSNLSQTGTGTFGTGTTFATQISKSDLSTYGSTTGHERYVGDSHTINTVTGINDNDNEHSNVNNFVSFLMNQGSVLDTFNNMNNDNSTYFKYPMVSSIKSHMQSNSGANLNEETHNDNDNDRNHDKNGKKENINHSGGVASVMFFSQMSTSVGLDDNDEIDMSMHFGNNNGKHDNDNNNNHDQQDREIITKPIDMTRPQPKSIQIVDQD